MPQPPFFAAIVAPLTWLPFRARPCRTWTLFNAGMLALCCWLLAAHGRAARPALAHPAIAAGFLTLQRVTYAVRQERLWRSPSSHHTFGWAHHLLRGRPRGGCGAALLRSLELRADRGAPRVEAATRGLARSPATFVAVARRSPSPVRRRRRGIHRT
jgi:hypothetical protein